MAFLFFKIIGENKKKIERGLRILYNDSNSDYNQLLNKSSKTSMEAKRLRNLALEVIKTLNQLHPEYLKQIFDKTTNLTHDTLI